MTREAPRPEPALSPEEREQFERGVREFNQGLYFECHDTLEELWSGLRGAPRDFFQGLIQVAVARYHLSNGNRRGALSLLARALSRLAPYPESYAGLDLGALRREAASWRERLERGEPFDPEAEARPRWSPS